LALAKNFFKKELLLQLEHGTKPEYHLDEPDNGLCMLIASKETDDTWQAIQNQ